MKIKERIEKIIEDYSFAKDEAEQRNRIKTMYKGPSEATESPWTCLLYTSPSPRDVEESRMPSSA